MGKTKNILISLTMMLIVGLAAWTTLSYRPNQPALTETAQLPDAYMEDVSAVIMDKFGKPNMKIITPKMVHYAKNDTANLTTPQLTLYRKSPQPWYISSSFATTTNGIENVHFQNDVTIHHPASINDPATMIKTASLIVYPDQQVAETADTITLIQPNITVKATGMHADLNSGDIKLLSKARGEYAPNS